MAKKNQTKQIIAVIVIAVAALQLFRNIGDMATLNSIMNFSDFIAATPDSAVIIVGWSIVLVVVSLLLFRGEKDGR